jgi:tRNA(Ile)-lysidine synthase
MSAPGPIDRLFAVDEVDRLFAGLAGIDRFGVAVSGGPDSTALFALADAWARRRSPSPHLHVLTVDHGLRPAARAEAEAVVALAARLQRPAELLAWRHDAPPGAGIQASARAARYRLLAEAARELDLGAVLLAHTIDDQAETVLIRLQRGSGVRGLAGMPARRVVDGVPFLRPLLAVPKARLVGLVEALGLPYVDDPSNRSDRFLRARVRRLMPDLAALGLDAPRLAGTAERMARADAALETTTDELDARAAERLAGVVRLDAGALLAAPDEIALRLLGRLCRAVRPGDYPPRAGGFERWLAAAKAGTAPRRTTLAGVVVDRLRSGLWIYAEAGRSGFPTDVIEGPGTFVWDGRFRIEVAGEPAVRLTVAPAAGDRLRPDLPKTVAESLPMIVVEPGAAPSRLVLRWLGEAGTDDD